jgi:hypothetical protein
MEKNDFREYNYEELINIVYLLHKDCERLRKELDKANKIIR